MKNHLLDNYLIKHVMYQMRSASDCLGSPASYETPEQGKFRYPSFACLTEEEKRIFCLNDLLKKGRVTLGRSSSSNIVLSGLDRDVSRNHGIIQFGEEENLVYSDTSSKGSIVVNSFLFERVQGESRILVPGRASDESIRAYILFGEHSGGVLKEKFALDGAAKIPDELIGKMAPHYRLELILEKKQAE